MNLTAPAPVETPVRQGLPDLLHGFCPCQLDKLKPPRVALCGFLKTVPLTVEYPPGVVPPEACVVCKELVYADARCPVCGKRNMYL